MEYEGKLQNEVDAMLQALSQFDNQASDLDWVRKN